MRSARLTVLALLAAAPAPAVAADWSLCPTPAPLPSSGVTAPEGPGETRAAAERVRSERALTVLEGEAAIRRGGRTVGAERIELERATSRARASGDVYFTTPDYALQGERGEFALDSGALSVEGARFRLPAAHAQGAARRITRDARGVSELEGATWSTCPPGDEAWQLAGGRVTLDPNTRQGTARDVTLWFQGVPLFYAPWFRFPLGEQRMSGFLAPRVGRSSTSGTQVAVPWYWNIAPNYDATLTPRWLARRGTQLQSQWRWLGPAGHWELDNEYLPGDELAGADRVYTRVQQRAAFGDWRTRVDAAGVSDRDYFEDLGDNIALSSQTHLRRRGDLAWHGDAGRFRARVQAYQTIDEGIAPASRPYEQLPQLTYGHALRLGGLETRLDAELVRFERDASDTAERLRLVPAVTWPLEAPGWFLRPRLALDHTSYRVERVTSTGAQRIERTLPVASLDTGLVFDRFGTDYLQTLEPRAYYAYVPEESQDDIPVFDSGRYGFSFAQLFRPRRFTGGDRVGDTNRVSLALTSRVLERASGREVLRGSIGMIRHLDERGVTLPGGSVEDATRSDVIAELSADPTPRWGGDVTVQWDPGDERAERGDLGLRYRGGGGGVANLGYRYQRGTPGVADSRREQVDVSGAWPVSARWGLVGRMNWSLARDENVETLVGIEYDSCCWRLRALARQYLNADDSADGVGQDSALFLELTLKGLGPIGDPAGSLLERAILGYRDPND